MKNLLVLATIILFVGFNSSANAQWYLQNNPAQNNSLNDIFVFDENNAIIVGGYGTILKTTDGGENWLTLPHDTTEWPSSVYFVNDSIGWLAGFGNEMGQGSIQKTTDGGETWVNLLNGGCCIYYEGVQFVSENIGWAVGVFSGGAHYGIISKTTDGGVNWISQNPFLNLSVCTSLYFIDNYTGWVAVSGMNQTILKTTDGGGTWELHPINNHIYSIFFTDYNTGWAVGWQGCIFKTSDGGENWINQPSGFTNYLYSVQFVNQSTGWAVGSDGIILHTTDGGENWISQPSGTSNDLFSVCFANENTGWIVGENGTILKTINGGDPIPVELTSFTATAQSGYVELNWSTATETNNMMFEIERRKVNSDFVLIGFVEGKGTTTERQEYSYVDRNVTTGKYSYRLKQIDFDGTFEFSTEIEVDAAPVSFSLEQNYPNPFNPSTKIIYSIPQKSRVSLKIFDALGREVSQLLNEEKEAGRYETDFNASDLSSGVYFYKIEAGSFVETKKMILIK